MFNIRSGLLLFYYPVSTQNGTKGCGRWTSRLQQNHFRKGELDSSFRERDLSQEYLARPYLKIKKIQVDFMDENKASTIGLWNHNYQKTHRNLHGECLQK